MRINVPVVPASFFGMVIGLAGLGTAWRWAHQVWGLPAVVGEAIIWLSIAVWVDLTILYMAKWSVARDDASAEVADPVQCCFVGLIGVATMLVAGGIQPYSPALAVILFTAGAAFAVCRTGGLWRGERGHAATTAVLYLPTVAGSFVTAISAAALGYADWGQEIFGGGLFSWIAIESVLLGRMLTGPELAAALRPTLGIQLAPAPVCAVAYLSVTPGPPDVFAHALIGYGVLQSLILLRLLPWPRTANRRIKVKLPRNIRGNCNRERTSSALAFLPRRRLRMLGGFR
jgi:tellurite resistance protein